MIPLVGKFLGLRAELDQSDLLSVLFKKLFSKLWAVLPHVWDWLARHGAAVINDETEVLAHLRSLLSEKLVVLKQLDVHDHLTPVSYLVLEST